MDLRYTWDSVKAATNLRRHRVSFTEAAAAFADPRSITIPDPDHSLNEERFVLIGRSDRDRLLVVVHTERGDLVRIISARPPSRRERNNYEEEA